MFLGAKPMARVCLGETDMTGVYLGSEQIWSAEKLFLTAASAQGTSNYTGGQPNATCSVNGSVDMTSYSKLKVQGTVDIRNNYRGAVDYIWIYIDNTLVKTVLNAGSGYAQQGYYCTYNVDVDIDVSGYAGEHTVKLAVQSAGCNYNNYVHECTVYISNANMKVYN